MIRLLLALLLMTSSARAAYLPDYWLSVRAVGMGNAYTAIVNDADSLFYNPAGLAEVEGFTFTIMDPHAGAGGLDAYNAFQDFNSSTSSNFATNFNKLYNKPVWIGGGAKTALAFPGFAAAGFASADGSALLLNPAAPTLTLNYFGDYGVAVGLGFDMIPKILKFGVSGRRLNRTGNNLDFGPSKLAQLSTSDVKEQLKSRGTGYGIDMGMRLTLPTPIKPSISAVWRNAGGVSFTHDEGPSAPPRIQDEVIVGAALGIALPPFFSFTPAVDYRYVLQDKVQIGNKLHVGAELQFLIFDVRAGLNQGYYSAGAGVNLGVIKVDAATYGVELGEYPGQREDRRYMVQATIQLSIGGSNGFSLFGGGSGGGKGGSGGGGGPRLKQRR